nr:unnamed protein product [Callosobruchus analis]
MRGNNECGFEDKSLQGYQNRLLSFKMRIALITVAAVISSSLAKPEIHPLSDEYIEHLNSKNLPWKAGRNFDKDIPLSYLKRLLGAKAMKVPSGLETIHHEDNGEDLPEEFDARKQWSKCESISLIRDQSGCASGWAVSAASVMSDRACIHSNETSQLRISAEDIVECMGEGYGCDGGFVEAAFDFWRNHGVVSGGEYNTTDGCKSYKLPSCDHTGLDSSLPTCKEHPSPQCSRCCDKGSKLKYREDKHMGKSTYLVESNERQIQLEIIKNGPVVAVFHVYTDFVNYKSGVYKRDNSSRFVDDHAVRVIGYGVEDNKYPYWLATNSWNDHWGENGLFRIMRGKDECHFEEEIMILSLAILATAVSCTSGQAKLDFLSEEFIERLNSKNLP